MEIPQTHYAWNGDVALAYQVFGEGPVDLVYMQGFTSHVDLNWESPYLARFLRGLGQQTRVIHTDRRGWGCSDRFSPGDVAPLEVQVDDLVTVMDAAGSERAVIFGSWDTGLAAILFAATYPERTAGLVLCDSDGHVQRLGGNAVDVLGGEWEEVCDRVRATWGTPQWDDEGSPTSGSSWTGSFHGRVHPWRPARSSLRPGPSTAPTYERCFRRSTHPLL